MRYFMIALTSLALVAVAGYEARFCTADEIVVEAEATREAQSRFASGWRASAPAELDDVGAATYQALSARCSEG